MPRGIAGTADAILDRLYSRLGKGAFSEVFLVETSRIDVEKNGSRGQRRNRQHGQMFAADRHCCLHTAPIDSGSTFYRILGCVRVARRHVRCVLCCAFHGLCCSTTATNRVSMVQCVPRLAVKREFKYAMKVLSKKRISEYSEAPSERELAKMQVGYQRTSALASNRYYSIAYRCRTSLPFVAAVCGDDPLAHVRCALMNVARRRAIVVAVRRSATQCWTAALTSATCGFASDVAARRCRPLQREILIMRRLSHPNVLRVIEVCRCHICTETGLGAATSAPGPGVG